MKNSVENYYVPSIEEFRIGFEYEGFVNGIWNKFPIDDVYQLRKIPYTSIEHNDGRVRVKHLDIEDIESFGFELLSEDDYFSPNGYNIYIGNVITKGIVEIYAEGVCFMGVIKNKSELRKILEQVKYYG
tara:strand:- start:161 stop:547 length:387 start_codon:yes stop_codon:yes gene_type:complete